VLGDTETAGRLLGAVEPLAERIGIVRDPDFVTRRERGVAAVQRKVGKSQTDVLLGAGRALPFDQAVDAALALAASLPCPSVHGGLTPRELEVLRLVAMGSSNAEIGHALSISPRTVTTHLTRIFTKLGVSSRTSAIAAARGRNLV
jgi:DNA-binding CsgD family transcriptional regulator